MRNEYGIQRKKPNPLPTKGSWNSQNFAHENICKIHQCQNCYENENYIIELCFNHALLLQITLEHLVLQQSTKVYTKCCSTIKISPLIIKLVLLQNVTHITCRHIKVQEL